MDREQTELKLGQPKIELLVGEVRDETKENQNKNKVVETRVKKYRKWSNSDLGGPQKGSRNTHEQYEGTYKQESGNWKGY